MKIDTLKQSYKEQLIKAGVDPQKAMRAAEKVTTEELQLIREIWSEWAMVIHHHDPEHSQKAVEFADVR